MSLLLLSLYNHNHDIYIVTVIRAHSIIPNHSKYFETFLISIAQIGLKLVLKQLICWLLTPNISDFRS